MSTVLELRKHASKNGLDRIKEWDDFLVEYKNVWKRVSEKACPVQKM